MKRIMRAILLFTLVLSLLLNVFQRRNQAIKCENINSQWKAEVLYTLGHKHLDGNHNGIPCEDLKH